MHGERWTVRGDRGTFYDVCEEDCNYSSDGDCDDGGAGAEYSYCEEGTDCIDCGPRGGESPLPSS